jgi:hypothetical protein
VILVYERLFSCLIVLILLLFSLSAFAENIDPDNNGSQYAWGENVGWLNLEPGGDGSNGMDVTGTDLAGYIWGENIGWISLSCMDTGNCGTVNYGVNNDGAGNLSGYAWGENVGWISFSCENTGICSSLNYGVTINPVTGVFSGYAWGENIGWINFAPGGIGIKTSWLNPQACTDNDSDGYAVEGGSCGLVDCNDGDPLEHPNQTWYKDKDNDGYSDGTQNTTSCTRPTGYKIASELTDTSGDCDDENAAIHPGATEVCDGVDNNCNGQIDEGLTTTYYRDLDADSYGDPANSIQACTQPSGYVTDNTDCNDNDAMEHPNQTWYKDKDNDGYSDGTQNTTSCTRPTGYKIASELTATSGDCNDMNPAINIVQGTCGIIDPEDNDSQYAWGENVGWINLKPSQGPGVNVTDTVVTGYAWGENIGWINLHPANHGGVTNDGAGNLSGFAWGENVGWINFAPTGAGVKVDPLTGAFSGKAWGENIGWINFGLTNGGVNTSWRGILDADGDGYNSTVDCDDGNPAINPGATEVCDGIDNNCDGVVDGITQLCYTGPSGTVGIGVCKAGTQTCTSGMWGSCVSEVTPTSEICDALDNDCDGSVDDNLTRPTTCGIGACASTGTETCTVGTWGNNTCTSGSPTAETCNNIDDNCDGSVDEGLTRPTTCGIGACSGNTGVETCSAGTWGNDTCDPLAGAAANDATCNGVDDDCNGIADEDYVATNTTCGIGACASIGQLICSGGSLVDTCATGQPQPESCDGIDNDCDGVVPSNEIDTDNDGRLDCNDNCPNVANPGQEDSNGNGIGDACEEVTGNKICSNLGNNPHPLIPDIDIFKFSATKGETVTVRIEADPPEAGSGKRLTLILTDKIKGTVLVKLDRSQLPNEITAKLPKTGEYLITVAEQVLTTKDKRYKGDYCLTLEATPEIYQTLEPFLLVE